MLHKLPKQVQACFSVCQFSISVKMIPWVNRPNWLQIKNMKTPKQKYSISATRTESRGTLWDYRRLRVTLEVWRYSFLGWNAASSSCWILLVFQCCRPLQIVQDADGWCSASLPSLKPHFLLSSIIMAHCCSSRLCYWSREPSPDILRLIKTIHPFIQPSTGWDTHPFKPEGDLGGPDDTCLNCGTTPEETQASAGGTHCTYMQP